MKTLLILRIATQQKLKASRKDAAKRKPLYLPF